MNKEQVYGIIRGLVITFGGLVAGFIAGKGWATSDQVLAFLNSEVFISLSVSAIMMAVGYVGRSSKNQIDKVSKLPEVSAVVTDHQTANVDLKENPKVVSQ